MEEIVNIELADTEGSTALHYAAKYGDREMCDTLLKRKAKVNAKTRTGNTPLMWAISSKNKECFDRILEEQDVNVTWANKQSFTALHWAAAYGDEKMCEALLERGANVNAKNADGEAPLFTALVYKDKDRIDRDYIKVVKSLLKNNAEVSVKSFGEHKFITKLPKIRNDEIINVLKSVKDIQSLFKSNDAAALHVAAWFGDEKLCGNLLKKGADVNETNNRNETALIVAARENKFAVVRILLENYADENVKSDEGTALQIAKKKGNDRVVEILERSQNFNFRLKLSETLKLKKLGLLIDQNLKIKK